MFRLGHASFLVQMDGVNILTDPIWSHRYIPIYPLLKAGALHFSGWDLLDSRNHPAQ
jgi:L-ascorbate metabolism protein UlaG (beta-lactamase superfamily)